MTPAYYNIIVLSAPNCCALYLCRLCPERITYVMFSRNVAAFKRNGALVISVCPVRGIEKLFAGSFLAFYSHRNGISLYFQFNGSRDGFSRTPVSIYLCRSSREFFFFFLIFVSTKLCSWTLTHGIIIRSASVILFQTNISQFSRNRRYRPGQISRAPAEVRRAKRESDSGRRHVSVSEFGLTRPCSGPEVFWVRGISVKVYGDFSCRHRRCYKHGKVRDMYKWTVTNGRL